VLFKNMWADNKLQLLLWATIHKNLRYFTPKILSFTSHTK